MTTAAAVDADLDPATVESIRPFFEPRAVAVVGVSRRPHAIGRRIFDALRRNGFPGPVLPIARGTDRIDGVRAWPTVREAGQPIDLAIVAVPRDAVAAVVDDCLAAGVGAIVVITAGFAETDADGRALQDALVEKVRAAGVRLIGPNCMGVLNAHPARPLNGSFSPVFPPPGGLALSSQSGALGIVILELAARRQVGLSMFASVGNKADVSSNDLIQFWAADPDTRVIALYLESFGNPRRFAEIARRVGRRTPIIAVKAGRTRAGSAAAGSHTAALAASDVAVAALFHQTGVIRADTIDEMFDIAACLDMQPLPAGKRVAIVTNAGGPGILAADACEAAGLTVVDLAPATRARLAQALPPMARAANPLDMIATAGPEHYAAAIATLLAADEVDALLILYTPVDATTAGPIVDAIRAGVAAGRAGAPAPPILACLMAVTPDPAGGVHDAPPVLVAGAERVPVYAFPENAARALGKAADYAGWRARPPGTRRQLDDLDPAGARAICRAAMAARGDTWHTADETARVFAAYGLHVIPAPATRSAGEAAAAARRIGFPVVAKLSAPALLHKSDVGGVLLDLRDEADVRRAFDTLVGRAAAHGVDWDAVVLQPMVGGGVETMIGVVHDRLFGSLVGFGLGGADVEVMGDVRFRVTPLTDRDITELLDESRTHRLLLGHRGRPPGDVAALADVLTRVSRLAEDLAEVRELDLNPVLVLPAGQGCRIVDSRVRVAAERRAPAAAAPGGF